MAASHEKGQLRIATPDTYIDPSLNPEIGDNEREFTQESVGATVQFPNRDYSIPPRPMDLRANHRDAQAQTNLRRPLLHGFTRETV
jgi:hypothetical protein